MKNIKQFIQICCLAIVATACELDMPITGDPNPNLSIYDLRKIYNETPVVLAKSNMKAAVSITGVVISDVESGNAPSGKIVLQGYKGNMVSGIALEVGSEASQYRYGDSLVVKVEGLTLTRKDGVLTVENVPAASIERVASGKSPLISATFSSISALEAEVDKYESTLIALNSMFVVDPEVGKKFAHNLKITDWVSEIEVPVNAGAVFANQEVSNLANYTFLLQRNAQGSPVLLLQRLEHVEEMEMEPYRPGELYEGFPEDFSDKIGGSSNLNHDIVLPTSGLPWIFRGAYILNSGNFTHTNGYVNSTNKGDQTGLMMTGPEGSYIELNKNLYYGASKMELYLYPATATDAGAGKLPLQVSISYSKDSGVTWHQIGDLITITENKRYPDGPIPLDIDGIVRFRITLVKKGANNDGGRLGIDYIRIYQK